MRFPESFLDELRSRVDIGELIGEYIPLKAKGQRLWGCCPFHNEKTPSFSVDTSRQMYYCFGCHKGGNVFSFVMEMDRMEFSDVVIQLADRVHMELPKEERSRQSAPATSREEKDMIREANREAARFYHAALWEPDGVDALNYLHQRGLNDKNIRHFGLGSTRKGNDACLQYLKAKGYSEELIIKAGLAVKNERGVHDMFRDRAMFPIIDGQGYVLGFGGRVLGKGEPKYLNTGDTPIFNKRRNLYAMNFLRKERGLKKIILSEGYMDVIALRCFGVEGVVATLGTALTEEQARLMKRIAPEVWISYDGDSAGQKAALRALDIFESMDAEARVLDYPGGMDPDEFVRSMGVEAFESLTPLRPAEYRMARAKENYDVSTEEGRMQFAIACCKIIRKVRDPVERDGYLKKLSLDTGYDYGVLVAQMGIVADKPLPALTRPRIDNERQRRQISAAEKYEYTLLTLLSQGLISRDAIHEEDFEAGLMRNIASLLLDGIPPSALIDKLQPLDEQDKERVMAALHADMLPQDRDTAMQFAQECLRSIRSLKLEELYNQVLEEFSNAPAEKREQLHQKLIAIENERKQIQAVLQTE